MERERCLIRVWEKRFWKGGKGGEGGREGEEGEGRAGIKGKGEG